MRAGGLFGEGRRAAWQRLVVRRVVAAMCAAVSVLGVAGWVRAQTRAETVPVVVAVRDLAAGHRLGAGDLTVAHWPVALRPPGSVGSPDAVAGRALGSAVLRGEPVSRRRVRASSLLAGQPIGQVAAYVPLLDPGAVGLASQGDRVDVLDGSGQTLAREAIVLAVQRPGSGAAPGVSPQVNSSAALIVAIPEEAAPALARATAGDSGSTGLAISLHRQ